MATIIGIVALILVVVVPSVLMLLLVYYGEKSRRAERDANRSHGRGFEVKQNTGGESPVPRQKENDHG